MQEIKKIRKENPNVENQGQKIVPTSGGQLFETVKVDVNSFAFMAKNTHCGK